MSVGTTDQLIIGYWLETAFGVSPVNTTPLKLLRITGESLKTSRNFKESDEITGKRDVAGLTLVDSDMAGDVMAQLSYSDFDEIIAASMGCPAAWNTDVAKNGTTFQSLLIEKKISDIAVPAYLAYPKLIVDTMKLSLKLGDFARIQFGMKGGAGSPSALASVSTAVGGPTPATSNPNYGVASDITSLNEGGGAITLVNSLEIDTQQNIRFQKAIGTLGAAGATLGQFRLTGSIDAYFQDSSLFDKFMDGTPSSLSAQIGTGASKKYVVDIPKIIYTDADVTAGGKNQDIVAKMKFTAYFDNVLGATYSWTRTP